MTLVGDGWLARRCIELCAGTVSEGHKGPRHDASTSELPR